MALIAVLMALSLPMLSHANAEARSVVCRQNLSEIGGAVTGYIRDYGRLPALAELPPHEPGMSLPELIQPRLQTPNVLFCPSDETERSQLLGTSYHWATAYNGFEVSALERAVNQPIVTDRESFHQGTELAMNELVLLQDNGKYRFAVTNGDEAPPADPKTQPPLPSMPSSDPGEEPPGDAGGSDPDEMSNDRDQSHNDRRDHGESGNRNRSNHGVRDHARGEGRHRGGDDDY